MTAARSAGRYEGSLRAIVHAFKYGRRRVLAPRLASLMREAGTDVLREADALVPVPLSFRRGVARGFNQADDLARCLGPPVRAVLYRARHGPPQATLPATQRHANVTGAYRIRPFTRSLRGLTLVLIDDVMTTGETMEACGRTLVEAGAESVRALTAARAVLR